ncbi:zinc-ribbon domain-containing protein [Acidicapsa acidisoli]
MQNIARYRGGGCLSTKYINGTSKLLWQCREGHQWQAVPNNVRRGRWCPACAGRPVVTIEEMREIAKERGGQCLSREYINNKTKLAWQCKWDHRWETTSSHIKHGNWCPDCADRPLVTIEEMQQIATSRNGKCLSAKYINSRTKLTWKCKDGHQWGAAPRNITQGHWCPSCARKNRYKPAPQLITFLC